MRRKIEYTNIKNIEVGLDALSIEEVMFPQWNGEEDTLSQSGVYEYGYPIDINLLIKELVSLKNMGSNYVSLEYHHPHQSALVQGLFVKTVEPDILTNDEINKLKNKLDHKIVRYDVIEKEREELMEEIDYLQSLLEGEI